VARQFKQPACCWRNLSRIIIGPTIFGSFSVSSRISFFSCTSDEQYRIRVACSDLLLVCYYYIAGLGVALQWFEPREKCLKIARNVYALPDHCGFIVAYAFRSFLAWISWPNPWLPPSLDSDFPFTALARVRPNSNGFELIQNTNRVLIIARRMMSMFGLDCFFSYSLPFRFWKWRLARLAYDRFWHFFFNVFHATHWQRLYKTVAIGSIKSLAWRRLHRYPWHLLFLAASFELIGSAIFGSLYYGVALRRFRAFDWEANEKLFTQFINNIFLRQSFFVSIGTQKWISLPPFDPLES